jgi:Family of unknown function (DUF5758)/Pentapeptide repeats (8 copies)
VRNFTTEELTDACVKHSKWLRAEAGGERAELRDADLSGADLSGAKLSGADLRIAHLSGAKNAELAMAMTRIVPEGTLIGWKKCNGGVIVKIRIPEAARRSNATGRKCRAEWAEVVEVIGGDVGISSRGLEYRAGEEVRPDAWDEKRWNECSHGIHFFLTREEAEAYYL